MSLYSRSYMRHDPAALEPRPWALKGLLIALAAVFLLQNILRHWLGSLVLERTFGLSLQLLAEGWLHTLVTYGFLHGTDRGLPWHLVINGLMLYWFGREVEARLGSGRFLECYLLSVLTGGMVWSGLHFLTGQATLLLGASAGVSAMLFLFCRFRWDTEMEFLFIPLRFTGRQLFWVLFAFQAFFLLFAELPGSGGSNTAYSAHLGGMLGAFLYERLFLRRPSLFSLLCRGPAVEVRRPEWERRAAAAKARTGDRYRVKVSGPDNPAALRAEVDRILDKINEHGFGALSEEEKRILDRAKDLL